MIVTITFWEKIAIAITAALGFSTRTNDSQGQSQGFKEFFFNSRSFKLGQFKNALETSGIQAQSPMQSSEIVKDNSCEQITLAAAFSFKPYTPHSRVFQVSRNPH
jgi:hypothetical protein